MNKEALVLQNLIENCQKEEGSLKARLKFAQQKRRQFERALHLLNQLEMPLDAVPDADPKDDKG